MSGSILATKLHIPSARANLVLRPRLIERLNKGLHSKLVLVSTPAGFGKTTLLSTWAGNCTCRIAWLSLDTADSNPARFLCYFIAALQTIAPSIGDGISDVLQSSQQPPIGSLLTTLLNEIDTIPYDFALVLDDYHVLDSKPIDDALLFLLTHLPTRMHLVIATREDPALPLARLRSQGQLTELRAADLRFTTTEAAEFLNQSMGLTLSQADVAALEARTEGWIAGLQLAAISMQDQQDTTGFIQSFSGSHHFVLDYLIEEVLQQQSEAMRTFLLHSAILDQMCGPLCDAVLMDSAVSGQAALAYLQRANLFLIALDNERRWYRYHHLFADLLRQWAAMYVKGEKLAELHARASRWYHDNGYEAAAFDHAIAAKDVEQAAYVAELAWTGMDRTFQFETWLEWMKKLPPRLIRTRPMLSIQYASALLDGGDVEAAAVWLGNAERWLHASGSLREHLDESAHAMVIADATQIALLPAMIAVARAQYAQMQGDVAGSINNAELALKLLPQDTHLRRAQASGILGLAHWMSGNLEAARQVIAQWMHSMQQVGNILFATAIAFALADILVAQGRLREAMRTYKQALQLVASHARHGSRVAAHLHLGLAMIHHEMADAETAAAHLLSSRKLGELTTLIDWPYRWHLAQARLKEAEGDLNAALDLLDTAKQLYVRNPVPDIRPIEALKVCIYLRQGRLDKAWDWVHERGLSVTDDLTYGREFEHMTLARLLIVSYRNDHAEPAIADALKLLQRLEQAAEASGRMGSVLEILVLQALAHEARGNLSLALVPLEQALNLAEAEGYVRLFVGEGPPLARLLYTALAGGIKFDYLQRLLAICAATELAPTPSIPHKGAADLIEALSERELEVLQFMAAGLTNPQIGYQLSISPHTVKVHSRNIYGKLDVHNRTQAVVRARMLGLLPPT